MFVSDDSRLSYNGVAPTVYGCKVSARPNMDEAQRTVVSTTYTIHVRAWVAAAPGDTTEKTMLAIRDKLMRPAGVLTFRQKGLGPINVNQDGVWDVAFGPKCTKLEMVPTGDAQLAAIDYVLETTIPQCSTTAKYKREIMEFNWCHDTSWDESGFLTIVCKGHVIIPMTRSSASSTAVPDSVDRVMEEITPSVALGFQRMKQHQARSLDGRRMDFEFIDEEQPSPKPRDVTRAQVYQEMGSKLSRSYRLWEGTFSGTITLAAGRPKRLAYNYFMDLIRHRLFTAFGEGPAVIAPAAGPFVTPTVTTPGYVELAFGMATHHFALLGPATTEAGYPPGLRWMLMDEFRARDEVYGRTSEFTMRYRYYQTAPIGEILERAGLWWVPERTWGEWRLSMNQTVNRPRGNAGWRGYRARDAVIDLCLPKPSSTLTPSGPSVAGVEDEERTRTGARQRAGRIKVDPERSWLWYESELHYGEGEGRFARHKPMAAAAGQQTAEVYRDNEDALGIVSRLQKATNGNVASADTGVPDVLHETRSPSPWIWLIGYAQRFGHRIPLPKIVSVGGVEAVLNRVIKTGTKVLWNYMGTPAYETYWWLEFLLAEPPRGPLPVPANPYTGTDGVT